MWMLSSLCLLYVVQDHNPRNAVTYIPIVSASPIIITSLSHSDAQRLTLPKQLHLGAPGDFSPCDSVKVTSNVNHCNDHLPIGEPPSSIHPVKGTEIASSSLSPQLGPTGLNDSFP